MRIKFQLYRTDCYILLFLVETRAYEVVNIVGKFCQQSSLIDRVCSSILKLKNLIDLLIDAPAVTE